MLHLRQSPARSPLYFRYHAVVLPESRGECYNLRCLLEQGRGRSSSSTERVTDCGSAAGTQRQKDHLRDLEIGSVRLHHPRESALVNRFGSSRVSTLLTRCYNLVDRSWLDHRLDLDLFSMLRTPTPRPSQKSWNSLEIKFDPLSVMMLCGTPN